MQMFETPAVLDQLGGQPVEQFGMRGAAAVEAEVVGRIDQAHAEVIMPQPIDDHPREQRIVGMGDPRGQPLAAFAFRGVGGQTEVRLQSGERRDAPADTTSPACVVLPRRSK